jgi:glycosyltransferase involved in cell wall biosynthesis
MRREVVHCRAVITQGWPRSVAVVLSLPYPATVGGAERYVDELACALGRRVDTSMHYMIGDGRRPAAPRAHDRLHRYRRLPIRESDRLGLSPALVRAALRADVVHVNHYGALTAHALGALGRLTGTPVFVSDHGSNAVALGRRLGLHGLFSGFLEVSRFATADRPPDRTRVIYGGVDTARHTPGRKDTADPFALFVGRLLPHKGVDALIDALPDGRRLVIAGRPDLAGHAAYFELLQRKAAGKRVEFRLDVDDAELVRLYRSATVAVLPSVAVDVYGHRHQVPELLGLTLIEAMACGTPGIATDIASLPEVITDGETGSLVAPGDPGALRAALRRWLDDPAAAAEAGRRARADALARFTWDQVAQRCLTAYAELAGCQRKNARRLTLQHP